MSLIPNLMYFKSAFNKISDLYYIPEESINNGLYYNKGDIIIKNLNYKINLNNIFNNLNIEIKMGNKVLIIGPNGCGKSTLLNMLYNYIDNYNGKITISNNNVLNINNSSLRDNICYIGQREELFIDTIINNIIIDREYNQRRLDIICNLVDLNSIISKKNYGINSLIDNNLSGGERQRIVLARALYRGFDILLLDEALSEVSHYLRLKIINNLNYFYGDKTIIFVSHNYEKYPFNQIINLTARKEFNVNR